LAVVLHDVLASFNYQAAGAVLIIVIITVVVIDLCRSRCKSCLFDRSLTRLDHP
jgi:ABC-type phosphate/phosphonate transport system permease subunit